MQLNKGLGPEELFNDDGPVQWNNLGQKIDNKIMSAGRDGRGATPTRQMDLAHGQTPGFDICCTNCQARGDFLQEVNKVLKNCIDFCEFPHRCGKGG